jgi:short-subunit dehydrogenase
MGVALITGASSGVGRELARRLNQRGNEIIVAARSADALHELADELGGARVVVADLSHPDGVAALIDAVDRVDLLVNNAGFGDYGAFIESEPSRVRGMVELNCAALAELTRAYLPSMVERHAGQILNVASTAAFQAGPQMAVYCATKAFVLSFSEAVAEEVRGTGVTVTAFCPGAFRSGFAEASRSENSKLFKGRSLPSSEEMAEAALLALDHKKVVAVPGAFNKIGAFMPRLTPRPVLRRAVHLVQREA